MVSVRALSLAPLLAIVSALQLFSLSAFASVDIDRAELEAFLDEFVQTHMEHEHIPGAVFYMVKDGEEFLAKGYGVANLETGAPMDPRRTVLAAGSLTKLFTATACMQLVEQGKLDLFADVNTYLETFKVDDAFDQPITLANLLEHTDGFDVAHIGVATRDPADVMSLETYLARHLPPRVRPPGQSAVYAEHGMTLAGYLVEVASGMPFEAYMRRHIFEPLGMERSAFRVRPDMRDHLSVGYMGADGDLTPVEPEFAYHILPAAGLYATAEDLGRFMIAHLNRGDFGNGQLVQQSTADLMFQQKFGLHPMLSAWSYGFHSRYHADEFCIEHGGMSLRNVSQMLLMPEHRIGFVIAGNSLSMRLHKEFHTAFLARFFGAPRTPAPVEPESTNAIDPSRFEGWYAALHRSVTTLERLSDASRQTYVEVTSPTTLRTHSTFDHVGWVRIGPAVYESEDGEARIAFVQDLDQNVSAMLNGPHVCERLPWWQAAPFHRFAFALMAAVFVTGLAGPLVRMFRRRPEATSPATSRDRMQTAVFCCACALNLVFLAGLVQVLRTANHLEFIFGLPVRMEVLLWLPLVTTALTPAMAGFALSSWMDRAGSFLRRMHETTIAAAAIGFIVLAAHWNLLGFNV